MVISPPTDLRPNRHSASRADADARDKVMGQGAADEAAGKQFPWLFSIILKLATGLDVTERGMLESSCSRTPPISR